MFIDNLNTFIPEKPKKVNEDKTFWIDNQVKKARNKNRLISFFFTKNGTAKAGDKYELQNNLVKKLIAKKKDFYQNKLQTQAAKKQTGFFFQLINNPTGSAKNKCFSTENIISDKYLFNNFFGEYRQKNYQTLSINHATDK